MSVNFKELDYRRTRLGELTLRRRRDHLLNTDVYEVKLNDDFLMSSLFTEAEEELAITTLSELDDQDLDVLIGGLGLGYTAKAALENSYVHSVTVIEALQEIIQWHRQGLVPLGKQLCQDRRCRLIHGDFFRFIGSRGQEARREIPVHLFHAILLDIDHSPRMLLHPDHKSFYQADGLKQIAAHLHGGGMFGMWSNEAPDDEFLEILAQVFDTAVAKIVSFPNPYQDKDATATIYIARKENRKNAPGKNSAGCMPGK